MLHTKDLDHSIRFEFNENVVSTVIASIIDSKKYIRIAIFQIHHQSVFDALTKKLKEGLDVEILTLPYDSINSNFQDKVTDQYAKLIENGAKVHFCKWNVGDPERTTTAVGRWYSYHGKFIVTDVAAISLSANFTSNNELDAALIFQNDQEKIQEFNKVFDKLLNLFVVPVNEHHGSIYNLISESSYKNVEQLFEVPRSINSNTHDMHWIKDYPVELCPENINLVDGLYICPFDVKGRSLITKIIQESKGFLYLSTESFTDEAIMDELIKRKLGEDIEICILTGSQSMDYSDRLNNMLRQLLASGIEVKTSKTDLHAKLIVSNNLVAVSSINLNKMNLGFGRTATLWRGNTETITICTKQEVLLDAKKQYQTVFGQSELVSTILAEKIEGQIKTILKKYFDLNSKTEAKKIFSRYILVNEIQVKKIALKIGSISEKIVKRQGTKFVDKKVILMALVLYFLSEHKHNIDQLNKKFQPLEIDFNINELMFALLMNSYVEQEEDYYKLKVESLI